VIYVKDDGERPIVVLDAAMNDLIRPALYDAWHEIVSVRQPPADAARTPADVVGPVCESTDTFARARELPPLAAGDLVALTTAGAYGAVMASVYNTRPLVPEVLVSGGRFAVIRERPAIESMLALDRIPDWLGQP
jgi:diaminopimelate decarboxylase